MNVLLVVASANPLSVQRGRTIPTADLMPTYRFPGMPCVQRERPGANTIAWYLRVLEPIQYFILRNTSEILVDVADKDIIEDHFLVFFF